MRTKVSRLIRHCTEHGMPYLRDSRGLVRSESYIRLAGQRIPSSTYRVTYRLDADGALLVPSWPGYVWNPKVGRGYTVCFLPNEWRNCRITRTVRVVA